MNRPIATLCSTHCVLQYVQDSATLFNMPQCANTHCVLFLITVCQTLSDTQIVSVYLRHSVSILHDTLCVFAASRCVHILEFLSNVKNYFQK